MKIVFLSNYYNHHQAHISEAFYKITGGSYRFIETGTISEERKKLGYKVLTDRFVINYNDGGGGGGISEDRICINSGTLATNSQAFPPTLYT